ncbi:unnamed protein product, partial [Amoebophrya sp. A25]|eukprot:GSA25T00019381001.1
MTKMAPVDKKSGTSSRAEEVPTPFSSCSQGKNKKKSSSLYSLLTFLSGGKKKTSVLLQLCLVVTCGGLVPVVSGVQLKKAGFAGVT